jgi:uncharacterized protein (UPF0332 family)
MVKAVRAAASAKLLLDSGDADGACNHAYYAMFDAARAALLVSGAPVEAEVVRTHGGLISAFSLHLVKTGRVPVELGRGINKAEEIRLVADYKGDPLILSRPPGLSSKPPNSSRSCSASSYRSSPAQARTAGQSRREFTRPFRRTSQNQALRSGSQSQYTLPASHHAPNPKPENVTNPSYTPAHHETGQGSS